MTLLILKNLKVANKKVDGRITSYKTKKIIKCRMKDI